MSALTITNVLKSYGNKTVLNKLSFTANPGEFIVLVGPSGCGKSTLLRSVAGLEEVTSGSINIGERNVTKLPPKDRDIAMVFQDYALYPHKSVYENIAFGLRIRKYPEAEIDRLVKDAAKKLDLMSYLERRPAALSGGQRQRVAIGRAIVRDPKLFLFDEPLSNLDAKLRGSMRVSIAKLHKELNATILYVTHDQVEAMTLADRIIVLEGGRIQQMGTPLELYYHPSNVFVATFIGSPPMNLIEGKVVERSGFLWFVSDHGMEHRFTDDMQAMLRPKNLVGKPVIWGIRPENMKLTEVASPEKENCYEARTVVTELLGPTSTVLCDIKGHELYVTLSAPHRPTRGTKLNLEFRSKHLYLFDKATTLSLVDDFGVPVKESIPVAIA
jgi:multiple sugar transport system ATP-binding protein